jgi:hypothetical protein
MEDREGFIDKYLGGAAGGAVSGALGSFFGEFFNLIRDAAFWILKKLVPEDWLVTSEDGSVKFDASANILTKVLAGIEILDFNRLIKDLVQKPFDLLASSLQYLSDLMGFGGEDKKAEAGKLFDDWWNGTTWGQKGLDVVASILNIVFSPITSIISEIETAFMGKDADDVYSESFTDKITKFVKWFSGWFDNLIPSKDDIMKAVALEIGPGKIASFLGLDKYFTDESIENQEKELAKLFDTYQLNMEKGGWGTEVAKTLINPIMNAQRELNELRQLQGMNPIQIFNTDNSQTNNGGGTAVVVEGTFSSADISNQLRANGILGANP